MDPWPLRNQCACPFSDKSRKVRKCHRDVEDFHHFEESGPVIHWHSWSAISIAILSEPWFLFKVVSNVSFSIVLVDQPTIIAPLLSVRLRLSFLCGVVVTYPPDHPLINQHNWLPEMPLVLVWPVTHCVHAAVPDLSFAKVSLALFWYCSQVTTTCRFYSQMMYESSSWSWFVSTPSKCQTSVPLPTRRSSNSLFSLHSIHRRFCYNHWLDDPLFRSFCTFSTSYIGWCMPLWLK